MTAFLELFFALVIGHALADYPLQGDFVARFKNPAESLPGPDGPVTVWPWVLGAHACIHAGAVWLITGSVLLGLAELVIHWVIDLSKCRGRFGFHTDQILHVGCKLIWAIVAVQMIGGGS